MFAVYYFFVQASKGNYSAWWAQHNEHRIILSRLFFWIDIAWFGGSGHFLFIVNYCLVGAAAYLFWCILKNYKLDQLVSGVEICVVLLLTAWLFLWCQQENLAWGFQSQFFLAQLLPLFALYQLSYLAQEKSKYSFFIACVAGVLSAAAMANGVLALPLMALFVAITCQGWQRFLILTVLSILVLVLYFFAYQRPAGHGSVLHTVMTDPLGMLQFICTYLGSPFYFLMGKSNAGKWFATFMGFLLILGSLQLSLTAIREPAKTSLSLALLCFILYIAGTAFGTAGGRLLFGMDVALSSRYTTPAIMAWASLVTILASGLLPFGRWLRKILPYFVGVLLLMMLVRQFEVLQPVDGKLQEQKLAALALELGVRDDAQLTLLFPSASAVRDIAEQARALKISVFGAEPYVHARENLGQKIQVSTDLVCNGAITQISSIAGEANFQKIIGWMVSSSDQKIPRFIRIVDAQNSVVGYAMSGFPATDLPEQFHTQAAQLGFGGYLVSTAETQGLVFYGVDPDCALHINAAVKTSN